MYMKTKVSRVVFALKFDTFLIVADSGGTRPHAGTSEVISSNPIQIAT